MFFLQFECSSYSFNLTRYQGSGVISAFRTNGEGSSSFLLVSFGNYSVAGNFSEETVFPGMQNTRIGVHFGGSEIMHFTLHCTSPCSGNGLISSVPIPPPAPGRLAMVPWSYEMCDFHPQHPPPVSPISR